MKSLDIFQEIAVDDLHLDSENPRLPENLKNESDDKMINWMLSDATLIDLMASIAENGFFPGEPIIVVKENGNFIVIEGNRRLAAIKLLNQPSIAEISPKTVLNLAQEAVQRNHIPKKIWVYIVDNRSQVENYLGFRHVTGVRQWPVISKARYVTHLYEQKGKKDVSVYKEIAKEIGSRATYVRRLLTGYRAFEIIKKRNYYNIPDIDEQNFDLSLITDAITMHSAIAEYIGIDMESDEPFKGIDQEKLREVALWLYQKLSTGKTRVGDNRNLRVLNKVLQNIEAREPFIKGEKTLSEAAELTDIADENIRLFLNKASHNLKEAQQIIHRSFKPDTADIKTIEEIQDRAEVIRTTLKKRFNN